MKFIGPKCPGFNAVRVLVMVLYMQMQWRIKGEGARDPNSFNFMQFLGKFGKIVCWRPPSAGELAPPPRGNPGSATEMDLFIREICILTDENPDFVELCKAKQWLQHQLIQLNAAVNEGDHSRE